MSLPLDKEILAQGAIALTLCLGGWMFFVRPGAEELHLLESLIAERKAVIATTSQDDVERAASFAPALRRRADEIEERGRLADGSQIYGRVQALAAQHSVSFNNLRPVGDPQKGKDRAFTATRVDMTVDGEYENIARFLEGLDQVGAYVRPISVQITPTKWESPTFTSMQLSFEVLRFNLPPELAKPPEKTAGKGKDAGTEENPS